MARQTYSMHAEFVQREAQKYLNASHVILNNLNDPSDAVQSGGGRKLWLSEDTLHCPMKVDTLMSYFFQPHPPLT